MDFEFEESKDTELNLILLSKKLSLIEMNLSLYSAPFSIFSHSCRKMGLWFDNPSDKFPI